MPPPPPPPPLLSLLSDEEGVSGGVMRWACDFGLTVSLDSGGEGGSSSSVVVVVWVGIEEAGGESGIRGRSRDRCAVGDDLREWCPLVWTACGFSGAVLFFFKGKKKRRA